MIYKYVLGYGQNNLALPSDSTPLSVAYQGDILAMWVLHTRNPELARQYVRIFHVVNTGEEFDIGYSNFIGTALKHGGVIVSHVFEQLDVS